MLVGKMNGGVGGSMLLSADKSTAASLAGSSAA